jgi:hypothetical protein
MFYPLSSLPFSYELVTDVCVDYQLSLSPGSSRFRVIDLLPLYEEAMDLCTSDCWNAPDTVADSVMHFLGMPMSIFDSDTQDGVVVSYEVVSCVSYSPSLSSSSGRFRMVDSLPSYEEAMDLCSGYDSDLNGCYDLTCNCWY